MRKGMGQGAGEMWRLLLLLLYMNQHALKTSSRGQNLPLNKDDQISLYLEQHDAI